MVAFRAEDARFFYGRTDEIQRVLLHLRHHRCLFVIGPSGSGKSSLISAGVLPQLGVSGYFPEGFWLVREMHPGSQPLNELAQILGGDLSQPDQPLARILAGHPPAQRLLLVVDRLEELFTQANRAERDQFIAALKALRAAEGCALILAMRADFYSDLMNSDLWPVETSQRLEISPLRGEALRRAIRQPAEDMQVYLEAGLLERLLADAANEPGALPLVQETMVLLWDRMERRVLPYLAYEQLGREGYSGMAVAMATKADATLAEFSDAQQKVARRIFLRLIQFGEGRADTRRQQTVGALRSASDDPLVFERTLRHLADNRLLTLSGEEGGGDRRVDIAHEMLIVGWPQSRNWVLSRREAELTRRRLEAKADEWRRLGRSSGGLLDEVELFEAQRWLTSSDAPDLGYHESLPALVQVSRAAVEAAEQAKEAARQRELQHAQAVATEQRRRVRTLKRSLLVAITLLLVTAATAGYALYQRHLADVARDQKQEAYHKLQQTTASSNAKAAQDALKVGAWQIALDASDKALRDGYPDEVELRLVRVEAFAGLNNLAGAEQELKKLEGRTDLGEYEGTILLWGGDLLLNRSLRDAEKSQNVVRQALKKGIKDAAEKAYARALTANTVPEAIQHLEYALRKKPVHHRANAMLAACLFFSGHVQKAHERVRFAEFFFPGDPSLHLLHAMLYTVEGQDPEAGEQLKQLEGRVTPSQLATAQQLVEIFRGIHQLDLSLANREANDWVFSVKWALLFIRGLQLAKNLADDPNGTKSIVLTVPPIVSITSTSYGKQALAFSPWQVIEFAFKGARGAVDHQLSDAMTRAAEVCPDGWLYLIRGAVLFRKGRLKEAEGDFVSASKTPSIMLRTSRLYGLYLAVGCEWELSRAKPPQPKLRVEAAENLRELVRELVRAHGIGPHWGDSLSAMAIVLEEPELARWIILEWEKQAPKDLALLRRRLLVEYKSKNYAPAIAVADKILERLPKDNEALRLRSLAVDSLRQQLEALSTPRRGTR
jgi:hypothetical protein